jgi:hypothetical protein
MLLSSFSARNSFRPLELRTPMKRKAVVIALVACFGASSLVAGEPPAYKRDAARVDKRIEDWQPTKPERAFEEIGWAKDLREALRLAKEHRRPAFLFTYDGASLSAYRC